MKINIFLFILLIFIILISCYQQPESADSGSVSIRLQSDIMRDAPAGYDGELVLAVFKAGDLDSLIGYSGGSIASTEISYLGDFPTPLLANNSVPFTGRSGVISLLNVPSDRSLSLLVEHYGGLYGVEGTYYHSYSGVSDTFEVKGGGTAEVAITLTPTTYAAGMSVNKYTSYTASHFRLYDPTHLSTILHFNGNEIELIDPSFYETFNMEDRYGTTGTVSGNNAIVTFDVADAILPGRKTRVLVSENQTISQNNFIGISNEFELRPGLSDYVTVTYYQYTSSSSWNYS